MHRVFAFLLMLGAAGFLLGGCTDSTGLDPHWTLPRGRLADGPSNIGPDAISPTVISVGWQDNSVNEGGFELQRSTAGATGAFALVVRTRPNVVSHQDEDLTAGVEYCYRVRSFKVSGTNTAVSAFSEVVCARTLNPPGAPSSVSVIPITSSIVDLTWAHTSARSVNEFRVERSALPAGPWTHVQSTQATGYRDVGRTSEAQVCYRVIAVNDDGSSPSSAPDCTIPPAPPEDLAAVWGDAQSVDLTWTDRSAAEDGFEIQRSLGDDRWVVVASPPANATSYRDAGLATDTRYLYRIRARRDGGFSEVVAFATALAATVAPVAPSTVNTFGHASTNIDVSWSTTASNVEGFRVERSINDGATWAAVQTVWAPTTSLSDGDRIPEQRACYRVFAFNAVGDSPPSSTDCVTPPAAVDDLTATPAGNGNIDLTWSNPSAITTGYSVEYLGCSYYYSTCYYYYEYWFQIAQLGADATTYRASGFSGDKAHQFRVLTLAPDAQAEPSPPVSSWTEVPSTAPSSLTATLGPSGGVDLRWTDNSSDETRFAVQRCTSSAAICTPADYFGTVGDVPPNTTAFRDTQTQPGVTYAYRIRATKNGVPSEPSNMVMITLPPP